MKKQRRSSGPTLRTLRVGEEVRHALSHVFSRRDFRDPVLRHSIVTITEVSVSPDLRNASVYIQPLMIQKSDQGEEAYSLEVILEALNRAESYFRQQVAKMVNLQYTPRLKFRYDYSFDVYSEINAVMSHPTVQRDIAAGDRAPNLQAASDESDIADHEEEHD